MARYGNFVFDLFGVRHSEDCRVNELDAHTMEMGNAGERK